MSNALSVAMVTSVIGRMLGEALAGAPAGGVESPNVTTLRPDMLAGADGDARGVNVFLYQVVPNGEWAGAGLPSRRGEGTLVARPQQALDLRYLLTFSGDDAALEPQRMLGLVVSTLAARPVLSRDLVRDVTAHIVVDDPAAWEQFSDLADQVDVVRLTLLPLGLGEVSNLWSTFFQTPYRLSVAYQATVVLLESDASPGPALPVRSRGLHTSARRVPSITRVVAASGPTDPVVPGTAIRIDGQRLRGPAGTVVRVADVEVDVPPGDAGDTRLTVALPAGVPAGIRGVQVVHPPPGGEPRRQPVTESQGAPIVVRPVVTGPVVATAGEAGVVEVEVPLDPPVGRSQRVVVALNEHDPPPERVPRRYSFVVPPRDPEGPDPAPAVTVAVPAVAAGDYLMRVQVDGAESVLGVDADGRYDRPRVAIP